MDFELPDSIKALSERASRAARAVPVPDSSGQEAAEAALAVRRELAAAHVFDLWTQPPGEHYLLEAAEVARALAYEGGTAAELYFINGVCGAMMAGSGNPAFQPYLEALRAGEASYAFALTEPEAGSDAAGIQTQARREGGDYVINGRKKYTTGAMLAHRIMVVARTEPDGKAKSGTSLILVPNDAKGLTVTPMTKSTGNAIATCELEFDNVRVPVEERVGEENAAWPSLQLGGLLERLVVASNAVGIAQRAYDALTAWLSEREQFGQPVGQFQVVRHKVVDLAAAIEAMRWLPVRAAWMADRGENAIAQINLAKLFCVEQGHRVLTDAFRLAGGRSYLKDDVFNRAWREGALGFFAGGTLEIQRETAARAMRL